MDGGLAIVVAGAIGLAWGVVADRIAARWPAHEDGSVRPVDWRTVAVAIAGALAFALLLNRFQAEPAALVYLGVVVVLLVLLFATDLDQRLLPDVITLPLVPYALVGFVAALGPFVTTPSDLLWAAVAGIALPALLLLLSIPFGAGAIGIGDLKLLFGVSLIVGAGRIVVTVAVGAVAAALGILVLLIFRRITLKSYVPYGPFLIGGAMWAILATPAG
jgi:leader peptidase (prepilin peptidase)/N-methyltransferase